MNWVKRILLLAFIGLLIYAFFYGPLLFLNPIKIDYERIRGSRVDVYTHDLDRLPTFYYELENDMLEAEELTGLKYSDKVKIFVARDSGEFSHFVPWMSNSKGLGGVSLYFGNVIYINPEPIRRNDYNEREFVRHELIHNLISQNSIVINNYIIDSQKWFSEGLAVYFGGPNYLSDLEFEDQFNEKKPKIDTLSKSIFVFPTDDVKFNSIYYRYFIDYLIESYGKDSFRSLVKGYVEDPRNFRVTINLVYERELILILQDFQEDHKIRIGAT